MGAVSSFGFARLAVYRRGAKALASEPGFASAPGAGGASSAFMTRRWPSNTAVVQGRSFAIMAAKVFAAAASLIGPATSRSCIPSPFWFSLITMIGRNAVRGPFNLHFKSPRQRARKPGIEFAPPTSTPNSVRCTASAGAADSCSFTSSLGDDDATKSGSGAAVMTFAGAGSTIFGAAGSGGASTDFETSELAAGVRTGALADDAAGEAGPTRGSAPEATIGGFSGVAGALAAAGAAGAADVF